MSYVYRKDGKYLNVRGVFAHTGAAVRFIWTDDLQSAEVFEWDYMAIGRHREEFLAAIEGAEKLQAERITRLL